LDHLLYFVFDRGVRIIFTETSVWIFWKKLPFFFHGRYSTPLLHLPDGYWNCSSHTCEHTAAAIQHVLRSETLSCSLSCGLPWQQLSTSSPNVINVIQLSCYYVLRFPFFFFFRYRDFAKTTVKDNNFQRFLKTILWQWTKKTKIRVTYKRLAAENMVFRYLPIYACELCSYVI